MAKYCSRAVRCFDAIEICKVAAINLRILIQDKNLEELKESEKKSILDAAKNIVDNVDLSEIQSLCDEMTSWRDNMQGTNLDSTSKYKIVDNTASELENMDKEISEIIVVEDIEDAASQLDLMSNNLGGLEFPGMYG